MPATSEIEIPESLGTLMEPFRYLGNLGKTEKEACRVIRSGRVKYNPRVILKYDAELAFYTTDESLEALTDIGDCPVSAVFLYDKTNSSENRPTLKEAKRMWKQAFRLAIAYLRDKGIEAHWSGIALTPLWVSAWTNVENLYYKDGHPSNVLLDSVEQHAVTRGCSVAQQQLHRKLIQAYAEGNMPYLMPDERIAKYYDRADLYELTEYDLEDIIGKIKEGRMFL